MSINVLCNRTAEEFKALPTENNLVIYFKMVSSARYDNEEWNNAIVIDDYKNMDRNSFIEELMNSINSVGRRYTGTIIDLAGIEREKIPNA